MGLVQYRNQLAKIDITKTYIFPKKVERLEEWWKAARRVIPEIPEVLFGAFRVQASSGWMMTNSSASPSFVRFDLENVQGEKAYVIIDRKAHAVGR